MNVNVSVNEKDDLERTIHDIVDGYQAKPTALIMALQDVQKRYYYLFREALDLVARKMDLPSAQIYGVATFFRGFRLKPKGKHHICICTGTACHVRQAAIIVDKFERDLGIKPGETTSDLVPAQIVMTVLLALLCFVNFLLSSSKSFGDASFTGFMPPPRFHQTRPLCRAIST